MKRVYGEPYEKNGLTVIPAARSRRFPLALALAPSLVSRMNMAQHLHLRGELADPTLPENVGIGRGRLTVEDATGHAYVYPSCTQPRDEQYQPVRMADVS